MSARPFTSPIRRNLLPFLLAALLAAPGALAVPLRVATFNVELGLGEAGTTGHEAARAILTRLDPEVVALQEIQGADLTGSPSALKRLATALGYPHIHLAGTSNVLDGSSRTGFLSRHPFRSATNIIPPRGANDMARQVPAVVVDLPGLADDPTIITLHLKCCFDPDDSFRRAVELLRVVNFLQSSSLSAADPVIVLGDFNLIGFDQIFQELPPGLPPSFVLGNDISFPVRYTVAPGPYFTSLSMRDLDARQVNGSRHSSGSSVLDHILATPALLNRPHASEIYNSSLDTANDRGLPKAGDPLPTNTSRDAGDHLVLFADFDLAAGPSLNLTISQPTVSEADPAGAAVLTITLPSPPAAGESLLVTLSSSDPSEAVPAGTSVFFGPGLTTGQVAVLPQSDLLADGSQSLTITAQAPGFSPATVHLTVTDASPTTFPLLAPGVPVTDDFPSFDGSAPPSRWPTTGGPWRGADEGSSPIPGHYAYGPPSDPSLGGLPAGSPLTTTATFTNLTGGPLTALHLAYLPEQWRAAPGGGPDRIEVDLLLAGGTLPIPALSFTADPNLPPGPVPAGTSARREAIVPGLEIPAGGQFGLRFTFLPATLRSGSPPDDVFLNEIHYDNAGSDVGEFLEIVVGPGFAGPLANLTVALYNGSNGTTYSTHSLDSFTLDLTTSSGHRLFSKLIPGIQNGNPDGLAIVDRSTVLHFLSYEGVFTATDGPAAGMSSTDLGVAQSEPFPDPGLGSLALTGHGGAASDFSWSRSPGPHTRGALNAGQTFSSPAPGQGLAIDSVAVTVLADTDRDGTPDLLDPDDDGDRLPDTLETILGTNPLLADSDHNGIPDGDEDADRDRQSNLAEHLLTLTDPLDPASRFSIRLAPNPSGPHRALLHFPTLPGRTYSVTRSHDLRNWTLLTTLPGTGQPANLIVPGNPLRPANIYRVAVTAP